MIACVRLFSLITLSFISVVEPVLPAKAQPLPTTEHFVNVVMACAAGIDLHINADIVGSLRSVYEGQRTQGAASFKSLTEFLKLFPEKDRTEVYKLYTQCIDKILGGRTERRIEPRARSMNLSGTWLGTIVQPSGLNLSYVLEMKLNQSGDAVSGWSRFSVRGEPDRWVEAGIAGTVTDVRATAGRQGSPPARGGHWCRSVKITIIPRSADQLEVNGDPDSGCAPWFGTLARVAN